MKNRIYFGFLLTLISGILPLRAEYLDWVDWTKIRHWAGDPEGKKKCALVIDFQDGLSNQSYVWGYRWNGIASGEDLVRAVAAQSSVLTAMVQYTGTMGSTLNAFGISDSRAELDELIYDFENASVAEEISFGYFEPNINMHQESSPGDGAANLCDEAIRNAKSSGIIEHPLNAFVYGYAAYDYDYWQLSPLIAHSYEHRWQSGWYDGYWSYWHGPNDYDYLSYSGLGMSSTPLADGGIQAWKYTPLNGGGSFGATGGEMAFELNYDMTDWGESMHEPIARQPLIGHDKIRFWVGQGEKEAAVVIQFNDDKGPDNLVYGYRWSGGWDDTLFSVISNIAASDPRLHIDTSGASLDLKYDSDHNGKIDEMDHDPTDGEWCLFVQRPIDTGFYKVPGGRWLNPNTVLIISHQNEESHHVALDYKLMRPETDSPRIISIPESMEYTLSDTPLRIPMFVEVPEGGQLSGAFTWTRPHMLSRINTSRFMGTVSSYSDFTPCEVQVSVRGSFVPSGATEAEGVVSNTATISFRAPEIPLSSIQFDKTEYYLHHRESAILPLIKSPGDATYTGLTFRSSDPEIVSVNAATGEITTFDNDGTAIITATYNFNPHITSTTMVNVGNFQDSLYEINANRYISLRGTQLSIHGYAGQKIQIIDMMGHVVGMFLPVSEEEQVTLALQSGIYIVAIGNCPLKKIIVR